MDENGKTWGNAIADEIQRLRSRIARLEAALKPFADRAEYVSEYADTFFVDETDVEFAITIGDLRRAAEALREKP
jgi:hypothetical protein